MAEDRAKDGAGNLIADSARSLAGKRKKKKKFGFN